MAPRIARTKRAAEVISKGFQRLTHRRGPGSLKANDEYLLGHLDTFLGCSEAKPPITYVGPASLRIVALSARKAGMRVLQVDNMQIRRYGRVRVSPERTLFNGLIRANFKAEIFSDRDVAQFDAPFRIKPLGRAAANRRLLEMCENFRPEVLLVGHADIITNETLTRVRAILPGVRIGLRNVDPLFDDANVAAIRARMDVVDGIFVTTSGDPLKQFLTPNNLVAYIPNASDPAVEDQDNSAKDAFEWDLVFCGVGNETDTRYTLVEELHAALAGQDIRFASFGMHGFPSIWGRRYEDLLETSKMGLSLNRFEGWPLYSSDRIAQLMGNGILEFVSAESGLQKYFSEDMLAFFTGKDDLAAKALAFNNDDARRKAVASKGRAFYREHFSAERISSFMVEALTGSLYSHEYIWADQVFRA